MSKDNLIITIGREKGSGGKYIGERLAELLGVKCYDSEIITKTAEKYSMDKNYVKERDEKRPSGILYFGGQSIPSELFSGQAAVIQEIAERESCVFIGRASDFVLREYPNIVNVFVHAPLGTRLERFCRREHADIIEAERIITRIDKERATFYQFYTNQIWGAAKNYHLSIDTSSVGIEGAIEMIRVFIEKKSMGSNKII